MSTSYGSSPRNQLVCLVYTVAYVATIARTLPSALHYIALYRPTLSSADVRRYRPIALQRLCWYEQSSFKIFCTSFVSWPYLSNGRAVGMVVVRRPYVYNGCIVAKR